MNMSESIKYVAETSCWLQGMKTIIAVRAANGAQVCDAPLSARPASPVLGGRTLPVPGLAEHAVPFKYLGDALRLRNHLVHTLEEAAIASDADERRRLLTFVVAGGGFSGVECIAEMHDFLRHAVRAYPTISPDEAADLICEAIRAKPKQLNTRIGTFGEVAYALAPKAVDQILHLAYKVFPDSSAAKGESDPSEKATVEQIAMANIMKGVHW